MIPDLFSPEFQEDPFPTYARLRRDAPVYREERYGIYMLTRFADVFAALRDHQTFSSASGPGPLGSAGGLPALPATDPPLHDQLRGLVNRAFTPRRVAESAPRIERLMSELLEALPGDRFDLVPQISVPLPVVVIAEMLGVEIERQEDFQRWSDAFVGLLENPRTEALASAGLEMIDYFRELAEERRRRPKDDLVSALVQAEIDGRRLTQQELDGFFIVLLVAGNETTTNLISNQLHILMQRPDLWKQLRNDRSLVPAAIEETVRFDTPVQNLAREATCDVELHETKIPKGSRVMVSYGAANRDADEFDRADQYRLDRGSIRHVGFGFGVHFCLGAGLARLEGRIALDAMLDRFSEIAPGDGTAQRRHSTVIRGFDTLPLATKS